MGNLRKFVNGNLDILHMKTNSTFKNEALDALRGNWGKAVLITILYVLLAGAFVGPTTYNSVQMSNYMTENLGGGRSLHQATMLISNPEYLALQHRASRTSGVGFLYEVLILFPLALGMTNAYLKLVTQRDNALLQNSVHIAFSNYWHKVWGMLLTGIFIFLWSLLFVIPGIIKSYSYAMTPYILEENPELGASEAIDRSRYMMRGHKFDLFWLQLSFIGWFFLCLLTAGIGFLWLAPYYETAKAAFYQEVKADYAIHGGLA